MIFFFCIFSQSNHQVDMKNVVKCYKHFFGYFHALKTHGVLDSDLDMSCVKDLSIEGAVVPGLLLFSKNKAKSPGTTAPSIERSLAGGANLKI